MPAAIFSGIFITAIGTAQRRGHAPEHGFMCGGDKCQTVMTNLEKAEALGDARTSVSQSATTQAETSEEPEPCSAGVNGIGGLGDDTSASRCIHGQPRHYACVRIPCPDNCGQARPLDSPSGTGSGDAQEVVDLDHDDTNSVAGSGGAEDQTPRKGSPDLSVGSGHGTSGHGTSGTPSGTPATTSRRSSLRNRDSARTPSTPAPAFAVGEVNIDDTDAKVAAKLFGDDRFVKDFIDRALRAVTDKKAEQAIAQAIAKRSQNFADDVKKQAALMTADIFGKAWKEEQKKLSAQRQKDVVQAKQFLDAAKGLAKKLSNMKGSEKKDNPASQSIIQKTVKNEVTTATSSIQQSVKSEVTAAISKLEHTVASGLNAATAYVVKEYVSTSNVMLREVKEEVRREVYNELRQVGLLSMKIDDVKESDKEEEARQVRGPEKAQQAESVKAVPVDGDDEFVKKIRAAMGQGYPTGNASNQLHGSLFATNGGMGLGLGLGQVGVGVQSQGTSGHSHGVGMSSQGARVFPGSISLPGRGMQGSLPGMGGQTGGSSQGVGLGQDQFMHNFGRIEGGPGNGFPPVDVPPFVIMNRGLLI